MSKKEVVAMILAGGQGTRLGELTHDLAKPAVTFGGKYKIIDFTLSNCINSGIDTVGILTQYEPLQLNNHIGSGESWGLNRINGGISILPPYQRCSNKGYWYKGTADAIYQNISYIDSYNPEYILILSGDHVYKMDYSKMIQFHKENEADVTIAVTEVPMEEASRFGIMNTNDDNSIYEFEEKPIYPKSNKASMGIYVFNWGVLRKFLEEDANDSKSSNDFGKNIIPNMLNSKKRMFAYLYDGYWKDVGTLESLWYSNMDLLTQENNLNLYDLEWPIYSNNISRPAQYISSEAKVNNALLTEGDIIYGDVINSIISPGVYIGKESKIIDSIIMENVVIGENTIVNKSIIADKTIIRDNCKIGNGNEITVVSSKSNIDSSTIIE